MKTSDQRQRAIDRIDDQLADRRDLRTTLIERRNALDAKIQGIEEQIHALKEKQKNI